MSVIPNNLYDKLRYRLTDRRAAGGMTQVSADEEQMKLELY